MFDFVGRALRGFLAPAGLLALAVGAQPLTLAAQAGTMPSGPGAGVTFASSTWPGHQAWRPNSAPPGFGSGLPESATKPLWPLRPSLGSRFGSS